MFKGLLFCLLVHLIAEPLLPLVFAEEQVADRKAKRGTTEVPSPKSEEKILRIPGLVPREEPLCRNREVKKCPKWARRGFCIRLPKMLEFYCSEECGYCVKPTQTPFECTSPFEFGCCWNGEYAIDEIKSNCPVCRDRYISLCHNMVGVCKGQSSKVFMGRYCPMSCGICQIAKKAKLYHKNRSLIKG